MKKAIKLLALTAACCAAAVSFVGCSDKNTATGSPDSLQFNTKYYHYQGMHDNEDGHAVYFIFYSDGTCMRYSHNRNNDRDIDIEMYYKYTYLDEQRTGIVCFIDGIKETQYNDDGSVYYVDTSLSPSYEKDYYVLSISKNVVMSSGVYGHTLYINENYVDEIPNFYPKTK